jgi:hypothetical protein
MKKFIKFISSKVKAFLKNDVVRRTIKTFVQAFVGVIITVNIADIKDMDSVRTILISGASAGVCAIWNLVKTWIDKKLNK